MWMRGRKLRRLTLAASAAIFAALVAAPTARAQAVKSADEISAAVAKAFGVEVLGVRSIETDRGPAYAVTVMNAGGDFDGAFRVSTIVVDARTGDLVPQFRHKSAGYDLPGAPSNTPPSEADGMAMRRMTYR